MVKDAPRVMCRCGAEIVFIKTRKKNGEPGADAPIDPKPLFVFVATDVDKAIYGLKIGYQSHFSTCPLANQYRKPKEKKHDGQEQTG